MLVQCTCRFSGLKNIKEASWKLVPSTLATARDREAVDRVLLFPSTSSFSPRLSTAFTSLGKGIENVCVSVVYGVTV